MNFQVTGLGLDKNEADSPQSFLEQEEVEEAEDGQPSPRLGEPMWSAATLCKSS